MDSVARLHRLVPWGLGLAGLLHLLAPRTLLGVAAAAYDRVLAVDFDPRDGAVRRVRLVGLAFLAGAVAIARSGRRE